MPDRLGRKKRTYVSEKQGCQGCQDTAYLFLSLFVKIKVARVARPVGSKKTDICFEKARLPGLPDRLGLKKRTYVPKKQGCQGCQDTAYLFLSLFVKIKVARVARPVGSKKTDICFEKARLPGLPGNCLLISKLFCENQGCHGCQTGWVEKNGHMF